ncbi:MAG TPA: HAD-IA family hydrolase, partial [Dongiaceae bacterium]|nr:HAD-IA family hydrolase [Dongiaceae bacterium]
MAEAALSPIDACVFDAYGTLFDVHAAAARCRDALGDKADAVSATWRRKQLEYTWLRSLMGRHADFWRVTGDALDYALLAHGIRDARLRGRLMREYLTLDAYPDARHALARLKGAGIKCAILSNGS